MGVKKEEYYRRKNLGICVDCGKEKAEPGKTMCRKCLDKKAEQRREEREICLRFGLCQCCKKRPVYGSERMCPECRADAYIRNKVSREKRGFDAHTYTIERRNRLKEQGLCQHCGRNPVENGKYHCEECLKKKREYGRRERIQNKTKNKMERSERPDYGLCYRCGKPLDRDGKICCACYSTNHFISDEERGRAKSWVKDNEILFRKRGDRNG